MLLFGISFKEKGMEDRKSVIIKAEHHEHCKKIFEDEFLNSDMWDIDKRTIKVAGSSDPLVTTNTNSLVLYGDLDDLM